MRVIAGKYKRRPLQISPDSSVTRPTSDRVKENTFNILAPFISDAIVLDLFAGSGALGIEALSRGAKHCLFVEKDEQAQKYLLLNLKNLSIPPSDYTVIRCDVVDFLKNPSNFLEKNLYRDIFAASISLIIADPPYASDWYNQALESVTHSDLCSPQCVFVLELPKGKQVKSFLKWKCGDERSYGSTQLQFWEREIDETS